MLKVLICNRDFKMREFLLALCKSKGCKVDTAENSGMALTKIQNDEIDAIFLDFDFPGMNIVNLVSVINQLRKNLYIILTAENLDPTEELELRTKNIFYFAHKPVDPNEIEKIINTLIDIIMKKEKAIEDKVIISDEELSEVVEKVKKVNATTISKKSSEKEKYDKGKRKEKGKIKSYPYLPLDKVYKKALEINKSIVQDVCGLDSTISNTIKNISLPKKEILQRTLIRPTKFIDTYVNNTMYKIINIFHKYDKN